MYGGVRLFVRYRASRMPNSEGSPVRLPDANFDLVVIATSFGGVEAAKCISAALPADFDAPIALVQHITSPSYYPEVLGRCTRLEVTWARHGARLRPRTIYVAPVDHHFSVTTSHRCALAQSPRVNYTRPAADVLFE